MNDGADISPRGVDAAVKRPLGVGAAAAKISRRSAIQRELLNILARNLRRAQGAGDEITALVGRMTDADMAEIVDHAFVRQYSVGENEFAQNPFDLRRLRITACQNGARSSIQDASRADSPERERIPALPRTKSAGPVLRLVVQGGSGTSNIVRKLDARSAPEPGRAIAVESRGVRMDSSLRSGARRRFVSPSKIGSVRVSIESSPLIPPLCSTPDRPLNPSAGLQIRERPRAGLQFPDVSEGI